MGARADVVRAVDRRCALGALVVLIAGNLDNWLNLPDWPAGLSDPRALLTGYFFVALGAVVHVAVEALKQQRFGAGTSFLALDDALNWLHIRYFSIAATVLWVLVGIFGLAATSDDIALGDRVLRRLLARQRRRALPSALQPGREAQHRHAHEGARRRVASRHALAQVLVRLHVEPHREQRELRCPRSAAARPARPSPAGCRCP